MAIKIHWQAEASGNQTQQSTSLFGQGFSMTCVGDVIVDTAWLLPADLHEAIDRDWGAKLQRCLLNYNEDPIELQLLLQGTPYSRAVWKALAEIPPGQVLTYSELADKLNSGPRAVALACRNNPYPGIIPCHRVVSKSGIGGFMGQIQGPWIELKRQLLSYERDAAHGRI